MNKDVLIDLRDGLLSGRQTDPSESFRLAGGPLIIGIHGGGYTSAFFDIPGYSLLDRAAAAGCTAIGIDRPGYGASTALPDRAGLLQANAERISAGIADLWQRNADGASGVVLVGHSIGAATTMLIAALNPTWPLLGIAVSGCGLASPPGRPGFLDLHPPQGRMPVTVELMNATMFGLPGTYADSAPRMAAMAHYPPVFREVEEVCLWWPLHSQDVLAKIRVPVHYRQAEHDVLVLQEPGEVDRIRRAFSSAPSVDAAMVTGSGHCIDFHHPGAEFQDGQIAFAIACAKQNQAQLAVQAQ
jgi:pimeloyl-ACP methyl ester carboxylesterase